MKKFLAIVITLAIMLSCFAMSASAAPMYPKPYINLDGNGSCSIYGGSFDPAEIPTFLTNHNISWDGSKWVLNNTSLVASELGIQNNPGYGCVGILGIENDVAIEIKGNCVIDGTGYPYFTDLLYSGFGLTIEGDGTLTVITDKDSVKGISSYDDLTIKGSVTVNVTTKNARAISSENDVIIEDNVKLEVSSDDACIYALNIIFNGKPKVNCITNAEAFNIHANEEIIFNLEKGGRVHGETLDEYGAMTAASSTTIVLNSGKITLPVGGKLSPATDAYFIVDADGNYAKKVTIEIPDEVETTTAKAEETTKAEDEEVAQTSDGTIIGAFVALGTVASATFISLKKKED